MAGKVGRPRKKKIHTSFENISEDNHQSSNLENLTNDLRKAVKPKEFVDENVSGEVSKSKVVFGGKLHQASFGSVEIKGFKRLSDTELKDISIIDPYISAIISKRCAQATAIGRPSESKFDKGTRIRELLPLQANDFQTPDEFEREKKIRQAQMRRILRWIVNCGTEDEKLINTVFLNSDNEFKMCNLYQFLQAQIRNLLTFGRCATQIIRDESGAIILFRPVAVETIYKVIEGEEVSIAHSDDTHPQSQEDARKYNELSEFQRPIAYVQRVDGQDVNFFTEDDLKIWNYQTQALFDLRSYPLAPIELAIYMVFAHQQTLTYLRNQFMKGLASKGMVVLESTSPSVQISEEDIEDFRQQFHNFVMRNDNSAVTPVIGGPVNAKFVPLNSTPRDLEFLQLEEHIVRALCSAFQISPVEMGYGNLGLNSQSNASGNKQVEIIYGEETGLRMVLDVIYDGLNQIAFEHFSEGKQLFSISYTGVGEDTRDEVVNRNVEELNTTATMNKLWADSDRTDPFPFGGEAPLAPHFNQFIVPKMKYWEFRKYFFNDQEAEKNPAYDFIIDPTLQQTYMQLQVTPIQQQQMQAGLQMQAQAQQMAMMQQQGQDPNAAQDPNAQEGDPAMEQTEKSLSLKDAFKKASRETLNKSYESLFKSWVDLHE